MESNNKEMVLKERLGKRMAYVLRYGAEKEGLTVSPDGFVSLSELATKVSLLDAYTEAQLLDEAETSVSFRNVARFETKVDSETGVICVRASYGRKMERNPYHDNTRVLRLMNVCIDKLSNIAQHYDWEDFEDDYLMNMIMRRMKRKGCLTNKILRNFLVPGLVHLDLWFVCINEGTTRLIGKNCPNLQSLSFRDCGYVITDHVLCQIMKGLEKLESLNLWNCHHVTDKGLSAVSKNCTALRHINLTFVSLITDVAILTLIRSCSKMQEIIMYHQKGKMSDLVLEESKKRNVHIETNGADADGKIYDSCWETQNFR